MIDPRPYLEKVEAALDLGRLDEVAHLHAACRRYEPIPHLPLVVHYQPPDWPAFDFQQIQEDPQAMLLSELARVYAGCLLKDDRLMSIRANYGTSIIPSLFGCRVRTFGDSLPVAIPLHDTSQIRTLVDAGIPDLRTGQGGLVFDMIERFREELAPYPNLSRHVHIDLADIQGPFDAAEVIWGSEIFLAMYDEPRLVEDFLNLVTQTIRQFILAHQRLDGEPFDGLCSCWGSLGRVCVREDAAVNLGLEHYEQFLKPPTQRLLDEFSGCIHWCGDGKAWWRSLIRLRGLTAVNPYQGEFYDPVEVHHACRQENVSVFQWTTPLEDRSTQTIKTGFTLMRFKGSLDAAKWVYDRHVSQATRP
jgi:uroporphyrinogen-III decarboxylase